NITKDMLPYYARKIVQYLSFSLFLYLLLFVDPLTERDFGANVFLRMSPLSAIGAMAAAKVFIATYWPALIILLLTIPFGRFFCAWLCPLGTTIDIADRCFAPVRKKAHKGIYDGRQLKYYLLAFLLISLFFGQQLVGWFDPISLATSVYTICVHPYVVSLINGILDCFSGVPVVGYVFDLLRQSIHAMLFAQHAPFFRAHGILLAVLVIVISFGMVLRRYWCRNLCPMGALFALFSDWSVFKRTVSSSCTSCGICVENCGMGAIGESGQETREGECVLCMTCRKVCPENSIAFRRKQLPGQRSAVDLSKRSFLLTGVLGAVAAPLIKMNYTKAVNKGKASLIRPPGAVGEDEFVALCIRCGECMKVCKTNGLHPVLLEGGIEALWTPKLIPRLGYCDYGCVLCTRVCPSGALRRLELDEKREVSLGRARIDHNRCIPWAGYARLPELEKEWQDFNCGVCEEVCPVPTKAIHFNTYVDAQQREIRRPFVREDVCIGCGFCEKVCPVLGTSAIVVEGIQPQTKIKSTTPSSQKGTKDSSVNNFLPNTFGEWKRVSAPDIFDGKERLFEFIDGGAEPYLSYSFIRVATVEYKKLPDKKVSVEMWEFGCPEDAFGVFSKDRTGADIKLGNGSALFDKYLFLWNDVYFIKIEPREGDVLPDEVVFVGKSIVNVMPYKKPLLPSITASLPRKHLIPESIRFFHRKIVLDNISISDNFTEDNVFGLGEKTDAVIAEYKPDGNSVPLKLMVVKYPDTRLAAAALQDALKVWRAWGEEEFVSGTIRSFQSKTHHYTSFMQQGNALCAVFFSESRVYAEGLLNDARGLL
ncbi:MAG: 4Fe-4S dicluster domain-containing protein, partial [Planctomycetes bacterium]|nr:4Fe-4S dicluster domain-containing protein [Planctomycetota bacterium]